MPLTIVNRRVGVCLTVCLLLAASRARAGTVETLQARGDASIVHDTKNEAWTVSAGHASLTWTFSSLDDFRVTSLVSPSGHNWLLRAQPDTVVSAGGSTAPFGERAGDFQYENASTSDDGRVLRLDVAFVLRSLHLRVTRHAAVADGTPTFEVWTTFQSVGAETTAVANINAFQLALPAGRLHWLTGRDGDSDDDSRDTAFLRQEQNLAVGASFRLGSSGRSSEQAVPWLAVDGQDDEFYAGLMWSGSWLLQIDRNASGLNVSWGLGPMTTLVGASPVEGPHAIFGVARGAMADATAALQSYVLNGIRGGRPIEPLVTYNTWFAYGTNVDEAGMRAEMDRAASLGAEVFVVDAGWYTGADLLDVSNFDQGLGSWEPDPARFPSGLKPLADYAHLLGLRFGVWVEPERVNLSTVGTDGFEESWLATHAGQYQSDHSAQVCLAGAAGRQWVVDRLSALLDQAQPDYLKWDNNLWVNCDRAGHGHGTGDGSFAHVTALYQILETLRQRYPKLLIENCSGGGNRIDFAMLRYSDVAWMDDRTAPSVHVRHNLEGLGTVLPPAYLLSFVTNQDTEPLHDSQDLSLYVRSRMSGVLGLCFRGDELSPDDEANIGREIAIYKSLRALLTGASASLLTPQAELIGGPEWDVVQKSAPGGAVVVFAYQNDAGSLTVNVRPTGLQPGVTYAVTSVDVGAIGEATGAEIMANGIEMVGSPATAAHILTLVATP